MNTCFSVKKICLFFIILHCTCDERMALKIEHQMFVTSFLCFVKIAIYKHPFLMSAIIYFFFYESSFVETPKTRSLC